LARDQDSGEAVVIEKQIEQSNHEHMGKLITYASGKDAKYIVWIVKDAREEHRAAIEWLNKISDDTIGFFNPLFRRVILLENTNKPARRIFDGQFCGLVSISFWH
jgi:GT2 family glycosyltransferase